MYAFGCSSFAEMTFCFHNLSLIRQYTSFCYDFQVEHLLLMLDSVIALYSVIFSPPLYPLRQTPLSVRWSVSSIRYFQCRLQAISIRAFTRQAFDLDGNTEMKVCRYSSSGDKNRSTRSPKFSLPKYRPRFEDLYWQRSGATHFLQSRLPAKMLASDYFPCFPILGTHQKLIAVQSDAFRRLLTYLKPYNLRRKQRNQPIELNYTFCIFNSLLFCWALQGSRCKLMMDGDCGTRRA